MKRPALQVLLLSVAFAATTAAVGWVAVPALALLWGLIARKDELPGVVALLAAGLGWAWLLVWNAAVGEMGELMWVTGGVMGLPGFAVVVLTLVFPMVTAWGAAVVGSAARPKRKTRANPGEPGNPEATQVKRPLLRGEIDVCGRTWQVREERRQGPRTQIFILTATDAPQNEMHIRPLPGQDVSTLDEVHIMSAEPDTRVFFDEGGARWEARIVVASTEAGDQRLVKLLTYQGGGQVFEEPYPFVDGLGLRTEDQLRELLAGARTGQGGAG
jgi:hypothetical protein